MLAFYYYKIAKNMPRVLDSQDELGQAKDYKVLYWTGVVLNALVPIFEGVIDVVYYFITFDNPPPIPSWIRISATAIVFAVGLLETVSGIFLIWSVYKIKSYLTWRGEDGREINLNQLILHSSAFALFLISVLVFTICYAITAWEAYGPKSYTVFIYSEIFFSVCSFASQVLLCAIFLYLSQAEEEEPTPTETFYE